jgi:hypothetical protein
MKEDEINGGRLHASPEGKRPFEKPSCAWEDNIKITD